MVWWPVLFSGTAGNLHLTALGQRYASACAFTTRAMLQHFCIALINRYCMFQ
jgi:hypothetical protein